MVRYNLIVTVLGVIFGVAIVLFFSFAIAKVFFPDYPQSEPPATDTVKEKQILAAPSPTQGPGGKAAEVPAYAEDSRRPIPAVTEVSKTGAAPTNDTAGQGLLASLLDMGIISRTVAALKRAAADLAEQVEALPQQVRNSPAGKILPAAVGAVLQPAGKLVGAAEGAVVEQKVSEPPVAEQQTPAQPPAEDNTQSKTEPTEPKEDRGLLGSLLKSLL